MAQRRPWHAGWTHGAGSGLAMAELIAGRRPELTSVYGDALPAKVRAQHGSRLSRAASEEGARCQSAPLSFCGLFAPACLRGYARRPVPRSSTRQSNSAVVAIPDAAGHMQLIELSRAQDHADGGVLFSSRALRRRRLAARFRPCGPWPPMSMAIGRRLMRSDEEHPRSA